MVGSSMQLSCIIQSLVKYTKLPLFAERSFPRFEPLNGQRGTLRHHMIPNLLSVGNRYLVNDGVKFYLFVMSQRRL